MFIRDADGTIERRIAAVAFKLYDTYGFPFDLTELMARERGFSVDKEGFENLMEEQRLRGRAAQKKEAISVRRYTANESIRIFVGYDHDHTAADVDRGSPANRTMVSLNNVSPFYAEMGGQVGDTGVIVDVGDRTGISSPTRKRGRSSIVHLCRGRCSARWRRRDGRL